MKSLEQSLPMLLNQTLDVIMPMFRQVFREYDLTEQQWRVLRVLWELGGCGNQQLAQSTLLPAPSLVGIVDRLEAKGLVKRELIESDRRRNKISLTEEGGRLKAVIAPRIDDIYQQIEQKINPDDWRVMVATLQQVCQLPLVVSGS